MSVTYLIAIIIMAVPHWKIYKKYLYFLTVNLFYLEIINDQNKTQSCKSEIDQKYSMVAVVSYFSSVDVSTDQIGLMRKRTGFIACWRVWERWVGCFWSGLFGEVLLLLLGGVGVTVVWRGGCCCIITVLCNIQYVLGKITVLCKIHSKCTIYALMFIPVCVT